MAGLWSWSRWCYGNIFIFIPWKFEINWIISCPWQSNCIENIPKYPKIAPTSRNKSCNIKYTFNQRQLITHHKRIYSVPGNPWREWNRGSLVTKARKRLCNPRSVDVENVWNNIITRWTNYIYSHRLINQPCNFDKKFPWFKKIYKKNFSDGRSERLWEYESCGRIQYPCRSRSCLNRVFIRNTYHRSPSLGDAHSARLRGNFDKTQKF